MLAMCWQPAVEHGPNSQVRIQLATNAVGKEGERRIVPDNRSHRGPHPEDEILFAADQWAALNEATSDLSWLLGRGYSMISALKLVGDRFQLQERQRLAVMRSACADDSKRNRDARRISIQDISGQVLLIDGYNVLTSVEAALGHGILLHARDDCFRDMASMHGTYRKVAETIPALRLIGEYLHRHQAEECLWYLDSPVSNSGRLKVIMQEVANQNDWRWQVELVQSPDAILAASTEIIATADSAILDRCQRWLNLARDVITSSAPNARIVDLSTASARPSS